jgi:indolepyruvate ferredoxin oxidoreductase
MSVQILNGNELLIQGGLEAGFHLYTGYPGSPLADFFNKDCSFPISDISN